MAKKRTAVQKIPVANIDEHGIYRGVMLIDDSELKPSHVRVPGNCDLAAGGYRWDSGVRGFVPTAEYIKQNRKG